jgi:subtilisin family serine protease
MAGLRRARPLALVMLVLSMLVATPAFAVAAQDAANGRVRLIVALHDSVERPEVFASDFARRNSGRAQFVYNYAFKGFSIEVPARAAAVLAQDPRVSFIEEDQPVYAIGIPTGVDRIEAEKRPSSGIDGSDNQRVDVDIAILDTGIANHPELNVVGGTNCANLFAICLNTGYGDVNGHGTHVAGSAAAIDGGQVVGVAPGARLWAVKVLGDNGGGSMSGIIAGIDWVVARAATIEVINMSLGCECSSSALDSAIVRATQAGIVVVAAAGNDGKNANTFSPGRHPNVISVSAMADFDGMPGGLASPTCRSDVGADDTFATFSNYGSSVTIAAPGVCIRSTVPGNGYAYYSGTSMASPHVAGAAALYIVENNVARNATRWSSVRSGLLSDDWSVPQTSECGFTGGKSSERMLMLAACGGGSQQPTTGTVSGTVTSSQGGAISGATVAVNGLSLTATTNSSGQYTISNVPAGSQTVTASATSFQNSQQSITVTAGQTVSANFTLTPVATTGTVSGTVTSSTGGPISGATVSIQGSALTTTTNASGQYSIANVPAGSQTVAASAATFQSGTQSVTVTAGQTVTANMTLTPLPTTGSVSGTVTSSAGGAVAGATVAVQGSALSTTTNGSGQYTLNNVPQGAQTLAISANGYVSTTQSVSVTAGSTATANVVLTPSTPQGGPLTVSVTTSSSSNYRVGQPVTITVTVRSAGMAVPAAAVSVTVNPPLGQPATLTGTTNANGVATLSYTPWLLPGTYSVVVTASKSGYTDGSSTASFTARR